MDFEYSDRCKELQGKLLKFMDAHIYPNENTFRQEVDRNGEVVGSDHRLGRKTDNLLAQINQRPHAINERHQYRHTRAERAHVTT